MQRLAQRGKDEKPFNQMKGPKANTERKRLDGAPPDEEHITWLKQRCQDLRKMRRNAHRRECFRNREWMRHAHYDAVRYLCGQWDVVISACAFSLVQTLQMVAANTPFKQLMQRQNPTNGKQRVIGKQTVSQLQFWSHFTFNQRLASRAETEGVHVCWTRENGTSKTCGRCGSWNANLGASETFDCEKCKWKANRDVNGARNNLLCALTGLLTKRNT